MTSFSMGESQRFCIRISFYSHTHMNCSISNDRLGKLNTISCSRFWIDSFQFSMRWQSVVKIIMVLIFHVHQIQNENRSGWPTVIRGLLEVNACSICHRFLLKIDLYTCTHIYAFNNGIEKYFGNGATRNTITIIAFKIPALILFIIEIFI